MMVVEFILIIVESALIALAVFCLIRIARIEVVDRQYKMLVDAVYEYNIDCLYNNRVPEVSLFDLMSIHRIFDDITVWKKEQMLPPEKFELIKPYLKK